MSRHSSHYPDANEATQWSSQTTGEESHTGFASALSYCDAYI